jgi:hypothetical protein
MDLAVSPPNLAFQSLCFVRVMGGLVYVAHFRILCLSVPTGA